MQIAIIADPHIGAKTDDFVANWNAAVAHVNDLDVAFTIVLGDLTLDGANLEADLAFARQSLDTLRRPVLVLPGNHDVGDISRASRQPASRERLERWNRHLGADRWICDDIPGWRLIGIDSQVLATGLAEEAEQWHWLDEAFGGRGERAPVLLTHMPLFLENWDEADRPYWAIPTAARQRLRMLVESTGTAAIVSAHIHRTLDLPGADGPRQIWAAATSFLSRDASMPSQPGAANLGITILDFTDGALKVRFDSVAGISETYIEDSNGSIYPKPE
ncbi:MULTISPECIES: metallophosphoesterase family protein [Rhizobium]|uniref:Metallophosphoesterase n=1 Tax=Rhizobium rhododendri TaxID=2506430 RepID=A0ABY8INS3_9HYPH|nr:MULTISPECIES: metallophosphoesterase [Rhizobium]MBO9134985.1 metallophosphoesterase [Rhizobium sp. B209b/85]MBO9171068.1 metallophosphoesterase [Rhizobium sp. L245/93]QXZ98090.1 metallophosphoesterase [Rhizobium sp. B230/85]TQX84846.1 metallophosphoesterase [Rhizobium sp. rho-13.1]TQY08896.1 metallophosphoesterase [Rhizobium sp. rho-1.1]